MADDSLLEAMKWKNLQNKNPQTKEAMNLLAGFIPGAGDVQSGLQAAQDIKNQKYADALLNGVGLLPFVPALGGVTKNPYFKEAIKEGYGKVISSPHGEISILSNNPHSPKTHSVTGFFVDEAKRNQGYGKELIDEALRQYPTDIGAQVSSIPSAKAFYQKGFKLNSDPNADFNEIVNHLNDYSSAYLTK